MPCDQPRHPHAAVSVTGIALPLLHSVPLYHLGPVLCLSISPGTGLLASGGGDGFTRLWSLESGTQLDAQRQPPGGTAGAEGAVPQVTAAAFIGPLLVGWLRGDGRLS